MDPNNTGAGPDAPSTVTDSSSNQANAPETIQGEIACNTETRLTESRSAVFSNIGLSIIPYLKWCPTSEKELEQAESSLLAGKLSNQILKTSKFQYHFISLTLNLITQLSLGPSRCILLTLAPGGTKKRTP